MKSPFHQSALKLHAAGWSVMPLMREQKRPFINDWTRFCSVLPTEAELSYWLSKPQEMNIGVCLGEASGLIALDFDDDVDGLHAKILGIIPDSPLRKTGSKGFTAFYRYDRGVGSRGFSKNGVRVLDVLSDGRQTVMPPSIHPDGSVYKWVDKTFADVAIADLPPISTAMLNDIVKYFKVEPVAPVAMEGGWPDPDLEEAAYTISHISPDDSYDLWLHVGMALKDEFGEGAYSLWDKWSATGGKYGGTKETKMKWHSFRSAGVGYGTIVMHAMSNPSFEPPYRNSVNKEIEDLITPGGSLEWRRGEKTSEFVRAEETIARLSRPNKNVHASLMRAPGLVGEIAQWINKSSRYPHPALAMGVALTIAGTLMAHKVQTETGLRTNLYCAGLSPSGGGKGHGIDCAKFLLSHVGMKSALSGKSKSGAAVVNGLVQRSGVQMIPWDEFGMALEMISNDRSSGFQKEILSLLTELFSCANSVYLGDEYANPDGKRPAIDIDQPTLCVYGASTEAQFYTSLSSKQSLNGFLPRWLIFHSPDYPVDEVPALAMEDVPPDLERLAREWADHPTCWGDEEGTLGDMVVIKPRVIPMDKGAKDLWMDYTRGKRLDVAEGNAGAFESLYARCGEHAAKIALCGHEGDTISLDVMTWAVALTEQVVSYAIRAAEEHMADNEQEATIKKFRKSLARMCRENHRSEGWVSHGHLGANTRWLTRSQRNEMLFALLDEGVIETQSRRVDNHARSMKFYRIVGMY